MATNDGMEWNDGMECHVIKCPICGVTMLVAWDGKAYEEDVVMAKIREHILHHTFQQIEDYLLFNLYDQYKTIKERLKE